jgi:hypothetical protein
VPCVERGRFRSFIAAALYVFRTSETIGFVLQESIVARTYSYVGVLGLSFFLRAARAGASTLSD